MFIERTNAEAKAPILWPLDAESWLIGKDPNAGKDWGQEKKVTEDEMVGWHYWLHGHEFEQTVGDNERQGSLACCSPCDCKELDMTEQLNNNKESEFLQSRCQHLWRLRSVPVYLPFSAPRGYLHFLVKALQHLHSLSFSHLYFDFYTSFSNSDSSFFF